MILLFLFQPIPSIPSQIKEEGLAAVLFLIILGWVAAIYAVNKIPKAIAPLVISIDRLVASNVDLANRITKLEDGMDSRMKAVETDIEAVRGHIHQRLTPAIAGLTIAYLKRAGFEEYAELVHKDNPDAFLPPEPKKK